MSGSRKPSEEATVIIQGETEVAQVRVLPEEVERSEPGFILESRAHRTAGRLHVLSFLPCSSFLSISEVVDIFF